MKTKNVTIEQLESTTFHGNHHLDADLFQACHGFIVNTKNSMKDRIRALKVVDRVMDLGTENEVDEAAVLEYVAETAEG